MLETIATISNMLETEKYHLPDRFVTARGRQANGSTQTRFSIQLALKLRFKVSSLSFEALTLLWLFCRTQNPPTKQRAQDFSSAGIHSDSSPINLWDAYLSTVHTHIYCIDIRIVNICIWIVLRSKIHFHFACSGSTNTGWSSVLLHLITRYTWSL